MELTKNYLQTNLIRKLEVGELFKTADSLVVNINPQMREHTGQWLRVTKVHNEYGDKALYMAVDKKGNRTGGVWHEYHMNMYATNVRLGGLKIKPTTKPSPNLPTI